MKVLMIINSLHTGGAEKLILGMIPMLRLKGVKVDLLLLDGVDTPFFQLLSEDNHLNIHSLGVKNSLYNPLIIFKLMRYMRNYDIVHVHLFPSFYYVAFANLFLGNKTKLIFTEHSTNNRRRNYSFSVLTDRIIYNFYDRVICITDVVRDELRKHLNYNGDKFKIINNGIDLNEFSKVIATDLSKVIPNHDNSFKYVIQVSNFKYPKDQKTVIKSLLSLPLNVHLILVGDGETLDACKDFSKKLKVDSRVHFLGFRNDIFSLLKAVDIVVLSSGYEGLSLSCIEALASGKPFIGSDVPGIRDVVINAGLLFEKGNDLSLASKIQLLLNDNNYYHQIANQCYERSKLFDAELMVDYHIDLYKEIYKSS